MAKNNYSAEKIANNMTSSILIHPQAEYNVQKMKQDKSFMSRLEKIRKIAVIF